MGIYFELQNQTSGFILNLSHMNMFQKPFNNSNNYEGIRYKTTLLVIKNNVIGLTYGNVFRTIMVNWSCADDMLFLYGNL